MNSSFFYTKIRVSKHDACCKNRFGNVNELMSPHVILLVYMKTQLITITPIIESPLAILGWNLHV